MRSSTRLIVIVLASAAVIAGLVLFELQFNPTSLLYFTLAWVFVVLMLLWTGNRLLTRLFNRYLSWLTYGNIRFFAHLASGIIYSLVVINATYAALKYLLTIDPPTRGQLVVMNVYGALIFIPIFSVYFSLHFLRSWRKSEVESEKFQKESMRSQLEVLKSHLDPHFLFNNLNILSSLIDRDKERSKAFLDKFAEVYRLILQSKSEDLITLREEMNFIESYIFLLQTRFEKSIVFDISIDSGLYPLMMPPLVLQMLIENAIKHNVITERKPLHISIVGTPDRLVTISNSLNARNSVSENMEGSGLKNIQMRYRHFTRQTIAVQQSDVDFKVSIPLLEIVGT